MDAPIDPADAHRLIASFAPAAPQARWGDLVSLVTGALGVSARDLLEGERLRLSHDASAAMPIGDVAGLDFDADAHPPRWTLRSRMLGLTGAVSPLASAVADLAHDASDDDEVVKGLLDILQHRPLLLLWEVSVPSSESWRAATAKRLSTLAGVVPGLTERAISRESATSSMDYSGAHPVGVSLAALSALLARLLAPLSPQVIPFETRRMPVPPDEQITLGSDECVLGLDALCSIEQASASALVVVELGSVDNAMLLSLLPGGPRHRKLSDWAAWMLPPTTEVQLRMSVAADDLPAPTLDGGIGSCLGFDTVCTMPGAAPQRVHVMLGTERAEWSIEGAA